VKVKLVVVYVLFQTTTAPAANTTSALSWSSCGTGQVQYLCWYPIGSGTV